MGEKLQALLGKISNVFRAGGKLSFFFKLINELFIYLFIFWIAILKVKGQKAF